jgi:hypothetical protein
VSPTQILRVAAWTLLGATTSGCGDRPSPSGSAVTAIDSAATVAGQTPPSLTPVVFAPGLVSGPGDQGNAVVYPGGKEIYFWEVERRPGGVTATIRVTRERNGVWSTPAVVPFSGTYMDAYIALHPDGSRLYFQSNRPIDPAESTFEYNLWYVEREGDGWSEARPMGRPINGRNHTGGASVTRDGTMYFTLMDLKGGAQSLYRSSYVDGAYQEPELLPPEVNVGLQNCDSYVAPDESYLVFTAFPRVGHGDNAGASYIAFRDGEGRWSPARKLGTTFNGNGQPSALTVSWDGRYAFFSREDPEGEDGLDVYWVSTKALTDAASMRPSLR